MNANVYLIRHGEVEPLTGRYGFDQRLTEGGKRQMKDLTEGFRSQGLRLDWIYASPATSAMESARIFALGLSVPQVIYSELRPVSYPGLEGKPQGMIEGEDEPIEAADVRINGAFRRVVDNAPGETVAFVIDREQIGFIMYGLRNRDSFVSSLDESMGDGQALHLVLGPGYVLESEAIVPLEIPRSGIER